MGDFSPGSTRLRTQTDASRTDLLCHRHVVTNPLIVPSFHWIFTYGGVDNSDIVRQLVMGQGHSGGQSLYKGGKTNKSQRKRVFS